MPKAFVLIKAEPGKEAEILKELKNMGGAREAHLVYGNYDIVVKVSARAREKLEEIILTAVRKIKGIRSTVTLMVGED